MTTAPAADAACTRLGDCPEPTHQPGCLATYRTDAEIAGALIPDDTELRARRITLDPDQAPIRDLDLSTRVINRLELAEIRTVADLTAATEWDLRDIQRLGSHGRDQIIDALARHHRTLRAYHVDTPDGPVLLIRVNGNPAPAADCDWQLLAPCGCVVGLAAVERMGGPLLDPDMAMRNFAPDPNARQRMVDAGYWTRLGPLAAGVELHRKAEHCPHQKTSAPAPA